MEAILKRIWFDEEGQELTESALLVAMFGLAAIAGWLNPLITHFPRQVPI